MPRLMKDNLSMADIMLIILVIGGIIVSANLLFSGNDDKSAFIYKGECLVGVYPLSQDKEIRIDDHNTVMIKKTRVLMLKADCHDKRCMKQGASDLLPIICLPNHVVVEIRSNNEERVLIIH